MTRKTYTPEEQRQRTILGVLGLIAFAIMCALGAIFGHSAPNTPCEQNWHDYGQYGQANMPTDHSAYVAKCEKDTNSFLDQTGQ